MCVLSDESRVCRFVLWEKLVNAVESGISNLVLESLMR